MTLGALAYFGVGLIFEMDFVGGFLPLPAVAVLNVAAIGFFGKLAFKNDVNSPNR